MTPSECPSSLPDGFDDNNKDRCDKVGCGQLCDGDSECGLDKQGVNNCLETWDLFWKVCPFTGYDVVALRSNDCPATSELDALNIDCANVQCGEMCEMDEDTYDAEDNCGDTYDMYWKHCADCEYVVVDCAVPSVRTSGTYSKTGTTCDGKPVYKCDTCSEDRYIKYVLNPHTRWIVDSVSDCGEEKELYMISDSTFWPDPTYVKASAASSWGAWRWDEGSYNWAGNKVQCAEDCPGKRWDVASETCKDCGAGKYSLGKGATTCSNCDAGKSSNGAHTACVTCAAGEFSVQGGTCQQCPAGKYSTGGQSECTQCGDGGADWTLENWDPTQSGLTSEDECKCAPTRTGTNCDQEVCSTDTPTVSLGFLLLEVQWPRHARRLSRNEAFSGISAAFRAFDANGDNRLSVGEARAGIAEGLMGVPLSVSHIWSRGDKKLYESDVTITEMIQDELKRLDTQQTKEFYEQPSGSGEITAMTATYPNPLTEDTKKDDDSCDASQNKKSCECQNEKPPILEWTVDRGDKIIYQQCAFFNGELLSEDEDWDNDVSDGKSNVDGTDCRGSAGALECHYDFKFDSYEVKSFLRAFDLEESDQRANCDLVALPNGSEECPSGDLSECTVALCGELCKGDGTCGEENDLNNCDTKSVYRKTCDSESETLTISKHSYCVQTKFCPPYSGTCVTKIRTASW